MDDRPHAPARPSRRPPRSRAHAGALGFARAWPLLVALLPLVPRAELLSGGPTLASASSVSSAVGEAPSAHPASGREARQSSPGWGRTAAVAPGRTDAGSGPEPIGCDAWRSGFRPAARAAAAPSGQRLRTDIAAGFLTDHALAPPVLL